MSAPLTGLPALRQVLLDTTARPTRREAEPTGRALVSSHAARGELDRWSDVAPAQAGETAADAVTRKLLSDFPNDQEKQAAQVLLKKVDLVIDPLAGRLPEVLDGWWKGGPLAQWLTRGDALRSLASEAAHYEIPGLAGDIQQERAAHREEGAKVYPYFQKLLRGTARLGMFSEGFGHQTLVQHLRSLGAYFSGELLQQPLAGETSRVKVHQYKGSVTKIGDIDVREYFELLASDVGTSKEDPRNVLVGARLALESSGLKDEPIVRTLRKLLDADMLLRP